MQIESRGIFDSRFDAPFVGTLIAAKSCKLTCPGCFHRERINDPIYTYDADKVLDDIQSDPFSEGIILGYFEWLDYQYKEALYLIEGAFKRNLQAILYTRRSENALRDRYEGLFQHHGLYIKCGAYDESLLKAEYKSYGVLLASTNQYIFQVK